MLIFPTKLFSVKLENNFHILTCFEYDEARCDVNGNRTLETRQIRNVNFEFKRPQKQNLIWWQNFSFTTH